jgi:hypothetical protein
LPSIVDARPRKHSEKPDWQYELIEKYFPNLSKIELNARRARPGWDAWGLEAPGSQSGGLASAERGRELPQAAAPAQETEAPMSISLTDSPVEKIDIDRLADDGCPHHDCAGAPALAGDIPEIPDALRIEGLTDDDLVLLDAVAPRTLNERLLIQKLRPDPSRATALERKHLRRMAARLAA